MTEEDYTISEEAQRIIEKTLQNKENLMIDTKTGLEATLKIGEIAKSEKVSWALVGGLAMHLYGSDRLTKDVDIIADNLLQITKILGHLKQGGVRYEIETSNNKVSVDWIIRRDEAKKYYNQALKDAVLLEGIPIISPEWLVILKYIAGRFKDQEDAVFLLSQTGLVNRNKIKDLIIKISGREGWILAKAGYQRLFALADGRTESEDSEFIDS
ncbi:MAG TPA: hypothetical protein PKY82_03200 [Pyrinomonadaceae bacterium]|nr:hypothetical protein [Pyrinomonadaceae bacterium]